MGGQIFEFARKPRPLIHLIAKDAAQRSVARQLMGSTALHQLPDVGDSSVASCPARGEFGAWNA